MIIENEKLIELLEEGRKKGYIAVNKLCDY